MSLIKLGTRKWPPKPEMSNPKERPSLTRPCAGQRSVGAGSNTDPGEFGVAKPVKMRMATRVQVDVIPRAEVQARKRRGIKFSGTILDES